MLRIPSLRLSVMTFVIGLFLGITVGGGAHTASTFYPSKWTADQTWRIGYRHFYLASETARISITTGDDEWNALTLGWLEFSYAGESPSVTWTGSACSYTTNYVIAASTPGYAGLTYNCGSGGNLTRTVVLLSNGSNWYVGSGTPSSNLYDLRSVVTHEFGHAMAFSGHFGSSDTACSQSPIHTMCSGISPGTTYKRTLETHDEHTFTSAY